MVILKEKDKVPLYAQLYQQIKDDILKGSIKTGSRLPSSRKLSADLRISRNTVELAYQQLYSEGFIISRPRKGYYAELPLSEAVHKERAEEDGPQEPEIKEDKKILYDFQNKKLNSEDFPFDRWRKLTNRCFNDHRKGFLQYGCPFGELSLRSEIQRYLYSYRRVECEAKQIIIGSGTQFCLELVCRLLKTRGLAVAMEDPGYDRTRTTFQNNGFKVQPVELDEQGINVRMLNIPDIAAVYVTPSHQFPTGQIMTMERRRELAEWAEKNSKIVIEDDYNCCFQYDTKPVPSLQSLCSNRTVYVGSFSDVMFPAIGISYAVLPGHMLDDLCERYCYDTTFVPFLTQKTLELFMREGFWERHLRRTVQYQKRKRNMLVSSLQSEFGNKIRISGAQSGLHLVVHPGWQATEAELVGLAEEAGIAVEALSSYWSKPPEEKISGILLNYRGMKQENIPIAVRLLRQAWIGN